MFNAREIAAHGQVTGLVMGTNDLIKDLGCRARADRMPLMTALQMIVMARARRAASWRSTGSTTASATATG